MAAHDNAPDPHADPATDAASASEQMPSATHDAQTESQPEEFGGPKGLEPTRYGDWERKGRCVDF
ncbi:DUF1674 domain-containing protein [Abyssibacter sp.]|jgi:hypothetical protein|uniref:DUF1674 domain-containing protein n=1 Tax=Abyssibacter sp. TaxID=2320200 RepID=UPI0025BBEA33|nr:DUF1674 domain-containing protein [Abyssibacter sp.]